MYQNKLLRYMHIDWRLASKSKEVLLPCTTCIVWKEYNVNFLQDYRLATSHRNKIEKHGPCFCK